jgi:hypothetical protein
MHVQVLTLRILELVPAKLHPALDYMTSPGCHFASRKQCCGSGMFIPDPGSDFFPSRILDRTDSIPDPGSASKNLSILTRKQWFLSSRKYDPGCSSRISDPDADFLPIPDPEVKKAPDPGSGSATLLESVLFLLAFPIGYFITIVSSSTGLIMDNTG